MTLYTIDGTYVRLFNTGWGSPDPNVTVPAGGLTGSAHFNVAAAAYPVGTVIRVRQTTAPIGWIDFAYLKTEATVVAAGAICVPADAAEPYEVSPDDAGDLGNKTGMVAIALGAMTATYHGWFWVGGVCPDGLVSALTLPAEASIAAGEALCVVDATSESSTYGDFALITAATAGIAIVGAAATASA